MNKTEYLWEMVPGGVGAFMGEIVGADIGSLSASNHDAALNNLKTQETILNNMIAESKGRVAIGRQEHYVNHLASVMPPNYQSQYELVGAIFGFAGVFSVFALTRFIKNKEEKYRLMMRPH